MEFKLKKNFLLGVSSAATQIEGGNIDNNWMEFYRQGGIKDGTSPAIADNHWKRWKYDDKLMASMKIKIARIGIEWARLFPSEHEIDDKAVKHYRKELEFLIKNNIKPLLTIHHFSNPMWFEKKGGWANRSNINYYLKLVDLVLENYGDIVDEYITINEPNVFAFNCYFTGEWYPNHKSFTEYTSVLENMAYAHIAAYKMIHNYREMHNYNNTMVSFANHLRVFDPKDSRNPIHVASAKAVEWLFQGAITEAMCLGKFSLPLIDHWHIKRGEYCDFNGINYYTRSTIEGMKDGIKDNSPKNDLGWEIYPEGLIRCATWLNGIIFRPIFITENGTCDNNDSFRSKYIFEHLKAISESALPITRYYHWCFVDNFEWAEGQSARFGLVHNDYSSQKRKMKKSGKFYSEVIANQGVTAKMYHDYIESEQYHK